MSTLDRYLDAATRENTRRSYASARRHFEEQWGGFLPATPDAIARYLADHAETLANATLRQRLAALARWHAEHGFSDPTQADVVKRTLRGIRAVHGARTHQAIPLQLTQLHAVDAWLETTRIEAVHAGNRMLERQALRDRALLLVGFWRAFRSDELARLEVRDVHFDGRDGVTLHLPRSKGDRNNEGRTHALPALTRLCPVHALAAWLDIAQLSDGPVFRRVTRWGTIGAHGLHPGSLIGILRRMVKSAGVPEAATLSSHSLRRGFAGWAHANGWDLKSLMEYVGWKDVKTAMRYVDVTQSAAARIESGLAHLPPENAKAAVVAAQASVVGTSALLPQVTLELMLVLSSYGPGRRGLTGARRHIEELCLARHHGQRFGKDGTRYHVRFDRESPEGTLDERLPEFLDELHRAAAANQCYLEATLKDPATNQCWD